MWAQAACWLRASLWRLALCCPPSAGSALLLLLLLPLQALLQALLLLSAGLLQLQSRQTLVA